MLKLFYLCILTLLWSPIFSQSQNSEIDSLLQTASPDSAKMEALIKLAEKYGKGDPPKAKAAIQLIEVYARQSGKAYWIAQSKYQKGNYQLYQAQYDSAIYFLEQSLKIVHNTHEKLRLSVFSSLGKSYWSKGNLDKALSFQRERFELAKSQTDSFQIAGYYMEMGNINTERGEYTRAMEFYTLALQTFSKQHHLKEQAVISGNIALVQRRLENYESAIKYLKLADSLYSLVADNRGKAYVNYNMAVILKNIGDLELATTYNQRALSEYQALGDLKRVAYAYYTMGSIWLGKNHYEEARKSFQNAIDLSYQVKDSVNLGYSYVAMGETWEALKNYSKAITSYQVAEAISQSLEQDLIAMDAYAALSKIYADHGDFQSAFHYKSRYAQVRDSFYTKEKRDFALEVEAKYQNQKKENELSLLAAENEVKTLQLEQSISQRNTFVAFMIIFILISVLIYDQYRVKKNSNRKLRSLDKLKSNFFANISHEFRTPLSLILGPLEQFEANPDEGLSRENLKMIKGNASRVLKLVSQLLDLSKLDAGHLKLDLTEGDIFKCLRATASSFNSLATQREIDYMVEIPRYVLWAAFDRGQLENIAYNLLGNAFKFTADKAVISFTVKFKSNHLRIVVKDSGIGISKDHLQKIFDRFYQADDPSSQNLGGTGIGLALTKELVELMNGQISVSSELNKGSTFIVEIPIQAINPEIESPTHVDDRASNKSPKAFEFKTNIHRNVPLVLLVEDNEDMQRYIREQLIKEFNVITAGNGKTAWQMANQYGPELIITDLMMPVMDGRMLCQKIRSNLATSHIPLIVLTAKAGTENRIEGLTTGADDYLTKPFNSKELIVRVKNLISQRKNLREMYARRPVNLDPEKLAVTSLDQKFLNQLLELLEKKYAEPDFSVVSMQRALAMSKTQLYRKLHTLTDETPSELLRNFRLKKGANLLSQQEDNVTQIAYKVGFSNLSYFNKCFKNLYGMLPSEYMRTNKDQKIRVT